MTEGRSALLPVGFAILFAISCAPDSVDSEGGLTQSQVCGDPVPLAVLPDELGEASGISRDPLRDGIYWVHNDSGNEFSLYAFDSEGTPLAVVHVAGATARDIEDVAVGPCPSGACLYMGDIGDNLSVRRTVSVHRLSLPDLPVTSSISPDVSWLFEYEDGAKDAEALAVDLQREELVVISKGRTGEVAMYAASIPSLRETGPPNLLRRVGRLPLPVGSNSRQFITAADISADGSRLAVRSYTTLYQFAWTGVASFDTATVPSWTSLMSAREPQGEGLAWDASGESLYLVGEQYGRIPPLLSRLDCPSGERQE